MVDTGMPGFLLQVAQAGALEAFLAEKSWVASFETIQQVTLAGEGNMNYTLRVSTNLRSFILKQALPYVVKYPQIPAPVERAALEAAFYQTIQTHDKLRLMTPELMAFDPDNYLLQLQDLGPASDYSVLYKGAKPLLEADLNALMAFVTSLHNAFQDDRPDPIFQNRQMRLLNAEHIFRYPFRTDTGHDLDAVTPGLMALALPYRQDTRLLAAAAELEQVYLSDGPCLLHGDFYPGSWLNTLEGVRVIDPEFCFYGRPEYDLGVLCAHLHLSGQPADLLEGVLDTYQAPSLFDRDLMDRFTGIEILRRILGIAQLPIPSDLEMKRRLLTLGARLLTAS